MKYVCELCGSIYDEAVGDGRHGIPAGTAFKDLPHYYACSCCGSEKEAFSPVTGPQTVSARKKEEGSFWQDTKYSDGNEQSNR